MMVLTTNVLIVAALLGLLGINTENGIFAVIIVGVLSGVGIQILESEEAIPPRKDLTIKEMVWFATIAPFQVLKLFPR